jgi:fatty-acyl-CoA synthase
MHYIGAAQGALMLAGPRSNNTLSHQFEKQAARRPKETFLFCGDRRFTFREGNALVNRHVAAYRELGLKKGDVVALYMENRPEYLWHFLALGKLGLVGALINTNLTGPPLVHAIRVGKPSTLVVGSELWSRLLEVQGELGTERVFVDHDPQKEVDTDAPGFGALVASASDRTSPTCAATSTRAAPPGCRRPPSSSTSVRPAPRSSAVRASAWGRGGCSTTACPSTTPTA